MLRHVSPAFDSGISIYLIEKLLDVASPVLRRGVKVRLLILKPLQVVFRSFSGSMVASQSKTGMIYQLDIYGKL